MKIPIFSSALIFDVTGERVFIEDQIKTNSRSVPVSALSKGMYFVQINNSSSKKIIKK